MFNEAKYNSSNTYKAQNEKELGKAIKEDKDYIEIEGDLAKKTVRIKATGKVAWGVVISAIGVAVAAIVITTGSGGTSAPGTLPPTIISFAAAASALGGASVATAAVSIALAGGGVATLNKLRKYKIKKISDDKIVLYK